MSSIDNLPGMRYVTDDDIEKLDQNNHQWKIDAKTQFYQPSSGFNPPAIQYNNLIRNKPSFLESPALAQSNYQSNSTFQFSPQQVYGQMNPTTSSAPQTQQFFHPIILHQSSSTESEQPEHPYHVQIHQINDVQKRPTRKRRRPPHSYASLIAQAILTSRDQRLTLRQIYEWVQTRYPHLYEVNETGWQNTIRHNLSLNRCFQKVPRQSLTHQQTQESKGKGSKGGYWTVNLDQLNSTNFGKQILESGFLGNVSYWHHQQEEHYKQLQKQHTELQAQTQFQPAQSEQDHLVDDIDFNHLVAPFYNNQQPPSNTNQRYMIQDDNITSFLVTLDKRTSFDSQTSQTSSVQTSDSPNSPASADFESTPLLQNNVPQGKLDLDPLLNPSLMRVNNILN